MNLSKGVKITRTLAAAVVGTASVNGGIIDIAGFRGHRIYRGLWDHYRRHTGDQGAGRQRFRPERCCGPGRQLSGGGDHGR